MTDIDLSVRGHVALTGGQSESQPGARSRSCGREIAIRDLPLYNRDLDDNYPPAGRALKDAIAAVDAVLFVTPEYNRGVPGVLKNAITKT